MTQQRFERLPGSEIVLAGIADLETGRKSVNASAVQCAAGRLRRIGLNAPGAEGEVPAAHELYRQLSSELGDGAHSRYNAIRDPRARGQLRRGGRACATRLTPSFSRSTLSGCELRSNRSPAPAEARVRRQACTSTPTATA